MILTKENESVYIHNLKYEDILTNVYNFPYELVKKKDIYNIIKWFDNKIYLLPHIFYILCKIDSSFYSNAEFILLILKRCNKHLIYKHMESHIDLDNNKIKKNINKNNNKKQTHKYIKKNILNVNTIHKFIKKTPFETYSYNFSNIVDIFLSFIENKYFK